MILFDPPINASEVTTVWRYRNSIIIIIIIIIIVTTGLSRTVSEINADFRRKSPIFPLPVYIYIAPLKGFSLELGIGAGVRSN